MFPLYLGRMGWMRQGCTGQAGVPAWKRRMSLPTRCTLAGQPRCCRFSALASTPAGNSAAIKTPQLRNLDESQSAVLQPCNYAGHAFHRAVTNGNQHVTCSDCRMSRVSSDHCQCQQLVRCRSQHGVSLCCYQSKRSRQAAHTHQSNSRCFCFC